MKPQANTTNQTEALAETIWLCARHLENTLMGSSPEMPHESLAPLPPLTPSAQHWLFATWRRFAASQNQLACYLDQPIAAFSTPTPIIISLRTIEALLMVTLTIINAKRFHPATLVNEAVKATLMFEADLPSKGRKQKSFTGLVNAILRRASNNDIIFDNSDKATLPITTLIPDINNDNQAMPLPFAHAEAIFQHPAWWINKLYYQYDKTGKSNINAADILKAGNIHAPMTLRFNQNCLSSDIEKALALLKDAGIEASRVNADKFSGYPNASILSWATILKKTQAIKLTRAVPVELIPKFKQGMFTVQDAAAQVVVLALQIDECVAKKGRVLDACAAPGGKSGQIAELLASFLPSPISNDNHKKLPIIPLLALDKSTTRSKKIHDHRTRLNLSFNICVGDLSTPECWWDGKYFDRILLDAPCSASGSMRRHPDGKWRLIEKDINRLALAQKKLLHEAANLLKPDGLLVYSTCSIFAEENSRIFATFCKEWNKKNSKTTTDLQEHPILSYNSIEQPKINIQTSRPLPLPPLQLLPNDYHDGHFIALWSPQWSLSTMGIL